MKKSTRRFLNLKWLDKSGIQTYDKITHYYFLVNPYNLSVLSNEVISSKIFSMLNVLKGFSELEIIALNQRENFERNKIFLKERIEEEDNPSIRKLLERDLLSLDQMQSETAASRMFLVSVQVKHEKNFEINAYLSRIEKNFTNNGFEVRRCNQEEIMTMLAVYYEQNVTSSAFDLIDGGRWFYEMA